MKRPTHTSSRYGLPSRPERRFDGHPRLSGCTGSGSRDSLMRGSLPLPIRGKRPPGLQGYGERPFFEAFDPPLVRASPVSERPGDKTLSAGPAGPAQRTWWEGSLASNSARDTACAMSEENVKTVRDAAEAFKRGDLDTWAGYLADDIDHRTAEGAPDDPGPIHGKDAVRAYVQDWQDTFDDFVSEPVELIDAGEDNVVAVTRISGRAKLSGVETDLTYAALYTLRDGKIVRGREYWTRDEALEAAGLRE